MNISCNKKDCLDNEYGICYSKYDIEFINGECQNFKKNIIINKNIIYRNKRKDD